MSDSKPFCLFGNHGMSVFVSHNDTETVTLETNQHTKGNCDGVMSLQESIFHLFEPPMSARICQMRTVRDEAVGRGLAGGKLG